MTGTGPWLLFAAQLSSLVYFGLSLASFLLPAAYLG